MQFSRQLVKLGKHWPRAVTNFQFCPRNSPHAVVSSVKRDVLQRGISTDWRPKATAQMENLYKVAAKKLPATISSAIPQQEKEMLKVEWKEGSFDMYPYIWLRDNCQCTKCFDVSSRSRLLLTEALSLHVKPTSVKVTQEGSVELLEIGWSDGHLGLYPSSWLKERSFQESQRKERQKKFSLQRTLWGSELGEKLPRTSYSKVLDNDEELVSFLQQVEQFGLVIIDDSPCQSGVLPKLSQRVGYLKRTFYGDIFTVKQKVDANNLAYTEGTLNVHVDQPYLQYKPGVQLLQCISQTTGEGGENLLVDSIHVAYQLKNLYPAKFDLLTNTFIDFTDEGIDEGLEFHALNQAPMIVLDRFGEVNGINFNQMARDSFINLPAEGVREWYEAMLTFYQLLTDPQNLITHKLQEGEILVFDNNRILHGRNGYLLTAGARELEGCYWDWDVIKSCVRVNNKKLGLE